MSAIVVFFFGGGANDRRRHMSYIRRLSGTQLERRVGESVWYIQTPTDGGVWATQWTADRFRGNLYTVSQKKRISFVLCASFGYWGKLRV